MQDHLMQDDRAEDKTTASGDSEKASRVKRARESI